MRTQDLTLELVMPLTRPAYAVASNGGPSTNDLDRGGDDHTRMLRRRSVRPLCGCDGRCRVPRRMRRDLYVATLGAIVAKLMQASPDLADDEAFHLAQEELGPVVILDAPRPRDLSKRHRR